MKNIIIALYAVAALVMTPFCYGSEHLSPIFVSQHEQSGLVSSSSLEMSTQRNNLESGVNANDSIVKGASSSMTAGDVLLAILVGVLVGAVVHAATKSDPASTTPTSQGTIDLNR